MNCERCGIPLAEGEKRFCEDCGCSFCFTTKKEEFYVPECHVAVCHNENEKRITDAVAAERERCAKIADAKADEIDEDYDPIAVLRTVAELIRKGCFSRTVYGVGAMNECTWCKVETRIPDNASMRPDGPHHHSSDDCLFALRGERLRLLAEVARLLELSARDRKDYSKLVVDYDIMKGIADDRTEWLKHCKCDSFVKYREAGFKALG